MVASILCGFAGFAFLVWVFPNCDASSKQGRMANSLPPERLAELYATRAKLRSALPADEREVRRFDLRQEQIPKEFEDLNCRVVRPGGSAPLIRLEGCMDHYLDMVFFGLGDSAARGDNSPRIELWSGEHDWIKEVLWRPEPAPTLPESGK